jgi:SPP1 gp7 family putative phage head morphogenesis protein
MPDPEVVTAMRKHKDELLAQEERKMREMTRRWLAMEKRMQTEFEALALEAARMREAGQPFNKAIAMRMERLQKLLFQARAETGQYRVYADDLITRMQEELAQQGLEHAQEAIGLALEEANLGVRFDKLHIDALETMFGLAGDGTPLGKWLQEIHPAAADGIVNALVDGIAQGLNPREVAKLLANGFGLGLQRALNTARTEMLRSYRLASLEQYKTSGVVAGYKRAAAHDERTCAGCLFTEGEFYTDLNQFSEHNQGRCVAIPVVIGVTPPMWTSGMEWFQQQSATVQESILGSGRFNAWQNGTPLERMVKRVSDPVWGGAFVPTPVGEL